MAPLKVDGWDCAFAVDPTLFQVPLVFGAKGDTLFVGILNAASLAKRPEISAAVSKTLNAPLFGVSVIDTAGIWNWLRQEIADPYSLMSTAMEGQDAAKTIMKDILEADLSLTLIKAWTPELEVSFVECSIVEVPDGKRLLPRVLGAAQALGK